MATYRTIAFRLTPAIIAAKADQADVASAFSGVSATMATKADQSVVDAAFVSIGNRVTAEEVASAASASAAAALDVRVTASEATLVNKADTAAMDTALAAKANASALATTDALVAALDQAAIVLVGPAGALEVNQLPGSANVYTYNGAVQTLS